jgi:H+-transporting ATPase
LFAAIILTKVIATVITVYGILLPAIGWSLALIVWGYALAWFVVQDFLKVWFYRLLAKRENGQAMKGEIP